MNDDPQRRALHNDSIENGEKRRINNIPPSCYFHLRQERKRCRYLVVPKTERDLCVLEDAYCDDNDGHQKQCGPLDRKNVSSCDTSASSSQRSSRRLLPSTQILISAMNETTSKRNTNTISTSTSTISTRSSVANKSLLLRKFYESISVGIKDHSGNSFTVTTSARPMKEKENVSSDKTRTQQLIDEIDDPSFSTLKIGHHKRYLQLTTNNSNRQQTSKRTPAQRKELGKLNQMILKEQALYRLALDKFHDCYKSRYLIGFGSSSSSSDGYTATDGKTSNASAFGRWACFQAQAINREWEKTIEGNANSTDPKTSNDRKNASVSTNKNNDTHDIQPLPKYYGKVRQTFALHSRTQQSSLDVQDLTCYVVYESMPTSQLSSSSSSSPLSEKIKEFSPKDAENNQDGGSFRKITPPTTDSAPSVRLLRNDPKALELAAKYSATIVTTSETLETLLRLPGDRSSKWMLPCTTTRTVSAPNSGPKSTSSSSIPVTILDLPIAQAFSSPRSCLEMGLQEGLYQAFLNQQNQPASQAVETLDATQNGKEKQDRTSPPVSQFVYSLWTLPTKNVGVKNGSRKPTKVIVRTLVRLRDSVSKLPVRLRARVEYFSTPVNSESHSRREIPNSYEKSLWILDQVLFGHQVFCLQYRIDPTTCGIVGWDATSVAHAFAASATDGIPGGFKSHHSDHGPLDHWKALIQLLQSIPSIDMPETLLCLPGRIGERNKTVNDTSREILLGKRTISTVPTDCQTQQQQEVRLDPFSVSVHAPCEDLLALKSRQSQKATASSKLSSPSPSSTVIITLDKSVLDQVGAVILGDQALRDCRREWEWGRPGQVPNTYPIDTME